VPNMKLEEALEMLERTPRALETMLAGLSAGWLQCREGEGTWNASEVVGHLIESEHTNWLPRLVSMLGNSDGGGKPLPPFDRFAHLREAERPLETMLEEFRAIRTRNIAAVRELVDPERDFDRTGQHPSFGTVKVRELLSTWAVHDLTHMSQIMRVMAERYREDVGPWSAFLGILRR